MDRAGAFYDAAVLAERLNAPVFADPMHPRAGFPQEHPLYEGVLAPARAGISSRLSEYDVVLVVGAPVFRYFRYQPGPPIEEGTRIIHITEDPEEAARSAAHAGIMGDVGLAIRGLIERLPERTDRPAPAPPSQPPRPEAREPLPADYVLHALAWRLPEAAILVEETPSSRMLLHRHVRVKRPGGFYSAASGGLGFGASASVGLSMASPDRPVACVVGDGSLMYAPQALWTAARYGANVAYVVLNNGQYGILKLLGQTGSEAPGLDLPNLDVLGMARSLGCEGETVKRPEDLDDALQRALGAGRPYVLDVHVDPAFPRTLG